MIATGIIRRIDDLGRIVIPKEIRQRLNIQVGDPLEIYMERDGAIMFKPYRIGISEQIEAILKGVENDIFIDNCERVEITKILRETIKQFKERENNT